MNTPTSTATAPHYTWGEACDGWHLVQTPTLSVIEERMPPNTSERRHFHHHAQQFFYVLSGELTMEINGIEHTLNANQGIEIPHTSPHQAINRSQADVHFLVTSQPPSHGDRTDA